MSTPKLAYIAAPYSDPDPARIRGRMYAFDAVVAQLMLEGDVYPVSPLLQHHILGRHAVPGNWTFFEGYSLKLLSRCDELIIVSLPGWETSRGVHGEIEMADKLSLPIRYVDWSPEEFRKGVAQALFEEFGFNEFRPMRALELAGDDIEKAREHLRRWGADPPAED